MNDYQNIKPPRLTGIYFAMLADKKTKVLLTVEEFSMWVTYSDGKSDPIYIETFHEEIHKYSSFIE